MVVLAMTLVGVSCGLSSITSTQSRPGDGTSLKWEELHVRVGPSSRDSADVASTESGLVVFGGETTPFGSTYLDDTWIYSSGTWTQVKAAVHPPALIGGGLAFDPLTGVTMLFGGGTAGGTCSASTWTFSGRRWLQETYRHAPPARYVGGMAFSSVNKGILMFGGDVCSPGIGGPSSADDTWLWTSSGWRELHPASSPPAANVDGMAYDPATAQVVLLTGMNPVTFSRTDAGETWVWNGSRWFRSSATPPSPADRWGSAMSYDGPLHEIVLLGGSDLSGTDRANLDDAWAWTGSAWKRLVQTDPPPAEVYGGVAFDSPTSKLVLVQADAPPSSATWLGS